MWLMQVKNNGETVCGSGELRVVEACMGRNGAADV